MREVWHRVLASLNEESLILCCDQSAEPAAWNGVANGDHCSPRAAGVRNALAELPDTIPDTISNRKRSVRVIKVRGERPGPAGGTF